MAGCPLYTTVESVKARLANKVQFQADPKVVEDGELPDALLLQLIADAEAWVEQDLRSRYAVPFRSKIRGTYVGLPDHSKRAIRTAVDFRATVMVLETDFGRGSHIAGDNYAETMQKRYDEYVAKLLGRDQEGANEKVDRFRRSPPLDDVALAPWNVADDGYKGMIINTNQDRRDAVSYATEQVNNPAQAYAIALTDREKR